VSYTPDMAAHAALAQDAIQASRLRTAAAQASGAASPGASPGKAGAKAPVKPFGKILSDLTPEKAEAAGMDPESVKTVASQALNKRLNPGKSEEKKLQDACEGFEAVFIGQMLKEMRKTVPKDGLLDSKYQEQYVSLFDEELSKTLTKQGGIGLTKFMKDQLAARAKAGEPQPALAGGQGPRTFAMDSLAVSAQKKDMHGLRDSSLNPLPGRGSNSGFETIPASQPSAGSSPGKRQDGMHSHQDLPPSTLAGLPSQHAGLPGSQYVGGAEAFYTSQPLATGEITSGYGWRRDPFSGRRAWHAGTDIAAPEGTPVKAVRDGTVVFSGRQGGYGNLVVVEHAGGARSYYGHCRQNDVAQGQQVKAGQVIAQVGQTGRATGPHLHFEVRVDGEAVDPDTLGRTQFAAATDPKIAVPRL